MALLSSLLCIQYVSQVFLMLADQLDNTLRIIYRRVHRRLLSRHSHDLLPLAVFALVVVMNIDRDSTDLFLILYWSALIYTDALRGEPGDRRFGSA